jgi:acyl-CoA synthetase (NDP forming)
MIASAGSQQYRQAIETLLAAPEVDALIVIYIPVGLEETAAVTKAIGEGVALARAKGVTAKPVLTCLLAGPEARCPLMAGKERVPIYDYPEGPARALSKIANYATWRAQPPGMIPELDDIDIPKARDVCRQAFAQRGHGWLSTTQTRTVLQAMRLPVAPGEMATNPEEAVAAARRLGFPVAVKLVSQRLVHKTEVGGVRLHLNDAAAVVRAYQEIRQRLADDNQLQAMEGVLVQPMLESGVEVMVGVTQDPLFGPLVAFGLGGIHVEILADVCFRVIPLTDRDAADMVTSIRGYRLLQGYRGHPAADVEALQDVLLRVSRLVEEVPAITELDLNPIFAFPSGKGCLIADSRIQVG